MLRILIAAILLAALLIAADANGAPGEPGPLEVSQAGAAKAQECRTVATASTTKTTSPGFTSETSTTCRYDKATNKSTCTNKYKDSFKTGTTTISVTTYAKLDDVIDETKVNPPRRRSLRTDTTAEGSKGKSTTSLVNTYDGQNRLVQEVGTSTPGTTVTTTYTRWDAAGRPTAGRSVV